MKKILLLSFLALSGCSVKTQPHKVTGPKSQRDIGHLAHTPKTSCSTITQENGDSESVCVGNILWE